MLHLYRKCKAGESFIKDIVTVCINMHSVVPVEAEMRELELPEGPAGVFTVVLSVSPPYATVKTSILILPGG